MLTWWECVGFSIQRLGPDSVQADFDGTPMVTDTMCDEDILALGAVLAERDQGFIQITQATGDIKADRGFCAGDRLHVVNATAVINTPMFASRGLRAIAGPGRRGIAGKPSHI